MTIFYKPNDGWAADFIPFYWNGEYHLFYLKDYRDVGGHGEGTPWFHLGTRDFVHFTDYGLALPRGTTDEQDLYVFTGSVCERDGLFHVFYTGHNPHLRRRGQPEQGIMHAISRDLVTWEKVPQDTFFAPEDMYEPHDWRDPYVFWNEEAREFWMLVAARLREGPSRRRGCTALCTSTDLRHWQVHQPFYAPGLYYTHECPDLFRMGDWWYLIFSEFSEAHLTRYRMARSLTGPWLTPADDAFDGRAFYAAKTASDGRRRFLFGWNPTREGSKDDGRWQWGGNLVVHELVQRPDGTLAVREPREVAAAYAHPATMRFRSGAGVYQGDAHRMILTGSTGYACVSAGMLPSACRISTRLSFVAGTRAVGLVLRMSSDFDTGYYIRFEPLRQRLAFDVWPRPGDRPFAAELERPLALMPGQPLEVTVLVEETVCEVYAGHQIAMSTRLYDHVSGEWGLFVSEGQATFENIGLCLSEDRSGKP